MDDILSLVKLLGIETSCDETAAAVVEDGRALLSNVVASQIDIHAEYGGVVPEVAARSHVEVITPVINQALSDANLTWDDIDGIAVTYAPGLIGSLLIGTLAARTLALIKDKPLYPVHHVEAHVYANFLTEDKSWKVEDGSKRVARGGAAPTSEEIGSSDFSEGGADRVTGPAPSDLRVSSLGAHADGSGKNPFTLPTNQPDFPLLALIVSGGHTQLVLFHGHGNYELLGKTADDAVGEAFDKVAKIIGLPYPGGPSIAEAATKGDPSKYTLPKAKLKCTVHGGISGKIDHKTATSNEQPTSQVCHCYDFSFSGLKTAVLRAVQREVDVDITFPSFELAARLSDQQRYDFAASFQYTAVETLIDATERAYNDYTPTSVVIAGGVAANQLLRQQLSQRLPLKIEYAPMAFCTDNAAMIATLGYYQAQTTTPEDPRTLEVTPSLSMTKTAWNTSR